VTYPDTEGTFTIDFEQDGSALSGTISIEGTPCLTGGSISGTVVGNEIEFGAVEGEVEVDYRGSVAGDTMGGTWSTDCGDAEGEWEAARG
jgi:hypothetical protein